MTPSSCSHPSRNLFPRAATQRVECFSILDQSARGRRRIVLGRIEADDDQILWADQPSLHKSSRRLSSPRFSPFIIARPATTSGLRRNEDRKSRAWRQGERDVCDRGNEEERFPFTLPRRERYTARMDRAKLSVVENIIEALIEPRDEIDLRRVSYLSGRLNISTERNFDETNFVRVGENGRECFDRIVSSIIDNPRTWR